MSTTDLIALANLYDARLQDATTDAEVEAAEEAVTRVYNRLAARAARGDDEAYDFFAQ